MTVTNNPSLTKYTVLNETCSSLGLANTYDSYDWTKPYDMLRFRCKNNYDYPLNQKYVWMYLFNPSSRVSETWHKFDIEDEKDIYIYQIFNNPNTNKNSSLSEFLKFLYTENNYKIEFQCASYYEMFLTKEKIYLIANSNNLSIIKGISLVILK